MFRSLLLLMTAVVCVEAATIQEKVASARKLPGYLTLYWDAKAGKVWLEIERWDQEFLYTVSLPGGLGSNDVGLDRGSPGPAKIVKFLHSGPKVLLLQPNYGFRATTDNPFERQAVDESFAKSVLFGFTVEAEEGNRVLVDATNFFLRDAANVTETLRMRQQGAFRVDAARSAVLPDQTRNFPKNTEVEVLLTFAADAPGGYVRSVTPTPDSLTLREHHSLVELPGPGYVPRAFDPRAGYFGINYMDFGTPFSQPVQKRFISRHRLEKRDPSAAVSEAVKPIVYYIDRGAPEPVRTALLEGARWWNQAFEAAGFRNAFQVELLPEDADPMDIRYNLVQWVHRSTRGWSYGATVTDPRTGEIIRGKVTLGSLRARQDYLIAEGLTAPYENGGQISPALEQMVLARLRQLSAHEIGHTLGLQHNYAASTHNRASVMDYPSPFIKLGPDGAVDLSDAYAVGIGEWDKVAITYGYAQFAPGADERAALRSVLDGAHQRGLYFISDSDSRDEGGAHPYSHLWDNGPNAVDELNRMLTVRAKALERFGEKNIREGAPMSSLEDVLVPLYLTHRYQVEAAVKSVGGLNYRYAVRGDRQLITEMVPAQEQRRALDALLKTIDPQTLILPERILQLIPPRAIGFGRTRETFPHHTGLTFDPVAAAESAAEITVGLLLNPDRAARLVQYHARQSAMPSLEEVIGKLMQATWYAAPPAGLAGEIRRTVDDVVLYHLMQLAVNEKAAGQARAVAWAQLNKLKAALKDKAAPEDQKAHYQMAASRIERLERNPKEMPLQAPAEPPPGMPIGCEDPEDR